MPPDLAPGAALYLEAFDALRPDRPVQLGGMGGVLYGRIPYGAIMDWTTRNGIDDPDATERLLHLVQMLDADESNDLNVKANKKNPS